MQITPADLLHRLVDDIVTALGEGLVGLYRVVGLSSAQPNLGRAGVLGDVQIMDAGR